jgi:type II secretory pathway component GspD/PulD (secretin)
MKLTLFFILIFNIGAFANVFSQTTVSLNFKEADLEKVLLTIENNSSYRFVYSNNKILTGKKITVKADNKNVTDVLDEILRNSGLFYIERENHLVAIAPAGTLSGTEANPQQRFRVSG